MDKPLSLPAKLLLLGAGGLAIVAGPVLFLLPGQTAAYFAWTIKNILTPVFMGANYFGGIGAILAVRTNRWSVGRVLMPGILVFAVTQLLATLLHIPVFNWTHIIAWAWLFVYVSSPIAAALVIPWMERGYRQPPPKGPGLPGYYRPALQALAVIHWAVGLALFAWPLLFPSKNQANAVGWWAWSLTPLTAQVVGGWFLAAGTLHARLSQQAGLDTAWIGLFSLMVVTSLQLIGALVHFSAFNGSSITMALYLLNSLFIFLFAGVTWARSARRVAAAGAGAG
jgi:hypothetical protein